MGSVVLDGPAAPNFKRLDGDFEIYFWGAFYSASNSGSGIQITDGASTVTLFARSGGADHISLFRLTIHNPEGTADIVDVVTGSNLSANIDISSLSDYRLRWYTTGTYPQYADFFIWGLAYQDPLDMGNSGEFVTRRPLPTAAETVHTYLRDDTTNGSLSYNLSTDGASFEPISSGETKQLSQPGSEYTLKVQITTDADNLSPRLFYYGAFYGAPRYLCVYRSARLSGVVTGGHCWTHPVRPRGQTRGGSDRGGKRPRVRIIVVAPGSGASLSVPEVRLNDSKLFHDPGSGLLW